MEQPSKTPPDHGQPGSPHRFISGLLVGSMVSACVWVVWWSLANQTINDGWVLIALPVAKVAACILCLCFPRWRAVGAGLLVSIAVGFLIFFGICALNLKNI